MSSSVSMSLRTKLLAGFFQSDLFKAPPFLYVALTVGVGLVNSAGSQLDEPSAGAYQRATVPLDSLHWTLSLYAEAYNAFDIDFPDPAPDEDWGYLGGWALLDAPDGGVVLASGTLLLPTIYTSDMPPLSLGPGQVLIGLID